MNNIQMLVTDLDGTLLTSDKTISEYTRTVLQRCRQAGIKVVYATGRLGSAEFFAPSALFDGKIIGNGATARIGDEVVYSCRIPHEVARPLLIACNTHGMKVASEANGTRYTNFRATDFWSDALEYTMTDFAQYNMDSEKIYLPQSSLENQVLVDSWLPDMLYSVMTTDPTGPFLSICHKDATKAKAVAELARLWGIAPENIVAFGDELNDVDMLEYAGIGVAMGNAMDEVKQVAAYVCDTNDNDGPAKWAAAHILQGPA